MGGDRKIDVEKETEAQKGHRKRRLLESDIQKIGIQKKALIKIGVQKEGINKDWLSERGVNKDRHSERNINKSMRKETQRRYE